ncbi:MAG TPA: hypothetical protein DCZ94_04475 [Lentisphaeria bacterium]|nr:MAG: hypothetical protein A2X48_20295 [Lentisphaerae bacterium GWF2_49_21]HBC86192.1 hypothetical protein [Lentisphaeria bacterium]
MAGGGSLFGWVGKLLALIASVAGKHMSLLAIATGFVLTLISLFFKSLFEFLSSFGIYLLNKVLGLLSELFPKVTGFEHTFSIFDYASDYLMYANHFIPVSESLDFALFIFSYSVMLFISIFVLKVVLRFKVF